MIAPIKYANLIAPSKEQGFTLIELMITLVISMVIMGGLMLLFMGQSNEYSYQNKRVDAVQDTEFVVSYIADDLRLALVSATSATEPTENAVFVGLGNTTSFGFDVWVDANSEEYTNSIAVVQTQISGANYRAKRKYALISSSATNCYSPHPTFTGKDFCLRYDREATIDDTANTNNEMLRGVTMFKIFKDDVDVGSRSSFPNIPPALPQMNVGGFGEGRALLTSFTAGTTPVQVENSSLAGDLVSGYTILLEVAVDSAYKGGSFINAKGVDVHTLETPARKRIIRYVQVYPLSVVP